MAVVTEEHGNHKHNFKVVDIEIYGLKINDVGKDTIGEAFGIPEEIGNKLIDKMEAFSDFLEAQKKLEPDLPEKTKISLLVDFLQSHFFKQIGYKLEEPSQYLYLGYVWACVTRKGEFNPLDILKKLKGF